jgi:hypothetical protein
MTWNGVKYEIKITDLVTNMMAAKKNPPQIDTDTVDLFDFCSRLALEMMAILLLLPPIFAFPVSFSGNTPNYYEQSYRRKSYQLSKVPTPPIVDILQRITFSNYTLNYSSYNTATALRPGHRRSSLVHSGRFSQELLLKLHCSS